MNLGRPPIVIPSADSRPSWSSAIWRAWQPYALAIALAASFTTSPCTATTTTDDIIDAIVARGTAIFSAKIEFEVSSTLQEGSREILDRSNRCTLSLSGDDWILRYHGSPDFVMNSNDSTVQFYQTDSEKTGTYRSLQMTAPTTIDQLLGREYTFAIARNGTLWYRPQLRFVDQERQRVEQREGEVVDGHHTVLLRWRIDVKDLDDAIVVVPRKIAEDLAGYLHVYAAPSLGYALPRIDYVTLAGDVVRRYESADFIQVDSGLFFPKSTQCIAWSETQQRITRFAVKEIQHVNQDLPNEEFDVRIPADTRVRDSRPGAPQVVFHLGDEKAIEEVAQMIDHTASPNKRFRFRLGCLAANGLLVLFLLIVWMRRQCRAS